MGLLANSRKVAPGGFLRKTLIQGAAFVFGVAFLFFVGWQGASFLNRLIERPNSIRLIAGFEGSPAAKLRKVSETYWVIESDEPTWKRPHFFLFRVEGAAGRTVTFEIRGALGSWAALHPVYSYAAKLDDLATFSSVSVTPDEDQKTQVWEKFPDTSGQSWQYIQDIKWQKLIKTKWQLLREGQWRLLWQLLIKGKQPDVSRTFVFRQQLDKDAYVCMRYPYTPGYNQRYLDSLINNPSVKVVTIGASKEGRPLRLVKIGEGGETEEKNKPCVVIYAREHADEQDGSWAAQGAIEFLISDAPEARQIREKFTFLVIPLLDPDGAAIGIYQHIISSFIGGSETPESIAYGAFFKAWVDKGNPLQLVLNLHNLESHEGPNLSLLTVEHEKERQAYSLMFYNRFLKPLGGFRMGQWDASETINRLGDWLSDSFGTLHMAFELNAQAPTRHLTIADLHQIGKLLVLASSRFLSSQEAEPFMASVDAIRRDRAIRWEKYGPELASYSLLEAEMKCKLRAEVDAEKEKLKALRERH